jgi:hypothetical protein
VAVASLPGDQFRENIVVRNSLFTSNPCHVIASKVAIEEMIGAATTHAADGRPGGKLRFENFR